MPVMNLMIIPFLQTMEQDIKSDVTILGKQTQIYCNQTASNKYTYLRKNIIKVGELDGFVAKAYENLKIQILTPAFQTAMWSWKIHLTSYLHLPVCKMGIIILIYLASYLGKFVNVWLEILRSKMLHKCKILYNTEECRDFIYLLLS